MAQRSRRNRDHRSSPMSGRPEYVSEVSRQWKDAMRLFTTRSEEYALRVAAFLARVDRRVATHTMAGLTGIPSGYIPSVVADLSRVGLLENRSGAGGGCLLARPAEEITALDVVEAMGGPLRRDACVLDHRRCGTDPPCSLHEAWLSAQEAVVGALRSVTVADIAGDYPFDGLAREATA